MKRILLSVLILMNLISLKAQTNYEDVVYLKNGSIIHGIIIEQIPNESIKIKSGQNTFVYKISEVQKMTKEEVSTQVSNNNSQLAKVNYNEKGLEIYLKKLLESESNSLLEFIDFKKTDGYSKIIDGQNWYTINFTFTFQPIKKIYKNGNTSMTSFMAGSLWSNFKVALSKPTGYDAMLLVNDFIEYNAFQPIKLTGYASLYQTEKGWTVSKLSFNKEELASAKDIIELEKDKIKTINNELNNPNKSYTYNQIEKRYFKVTNLPNQETSNIELSKIEAINTNFNATEIQNIITNAFDNSTRIEKSIINNTSNKYVYEFTLNSLDYTYDQGKKLVSNEPYAGYTCALSIKYKIINKNDNSILNEEKLIIPGGNPKTNTTKEKAYNDCTKNLEATMKNMVWYYNPLLCNFNDVNSSNKKGLPKTISLNNSQYLTSDMNIYFALVELNDIYYDKGELKYKNVIATSEFDKIDGENIICKLKSGEGNLKEYIDSGKKFVAISSIKKLDKID